MDLQTISVKYCWGVSILQCLGFGPNINAVCLILTWSK